ncbi:hypothetical protein ACET3Z_032458 [Daucus carota]
MTKCIAPKSPEQKTLVTSKQTERIPVPFPPYGASVAAEFTDIPAFIYSSAVLSVTCFYSIITTILSFFALVKHSTPSTKLMSCVFSVDVLLLGILASATGASGEAAYLGLKGNSNVGWHKMCNVYDSYCRHIGFSVLTSIFSSMVILTPGVEKFSRGLVKGNHYFVSVMEVLDKVGSEPELLETHSHTENDEGEKEEEDGWIDVISDSSSDQPVKKVKNLKTLFRSMVQIP